MILSFTGATGFLGRHLLTHLVQTLPPNVTFRILLQGQLPAGFPHPQRLEIIQADLSNTKALARLVDGADVCIHLAAQRGHATRERFFEVNVEGTRRLLDALSSHAPQCRMVYSSSICALRTPGESRWFSGAYARSKAQAHQLVEQNPNAAIIIPGLIYGPGDIHVIPTLGRLLAGKKIPFLIRATGAAPLSYIDDLVALFAEVIENPKSKGQQYLGYLSVEGGMPQVLRSLSEVMQVPPPPERFLPRAPMLAAARLVEQAHDYIKTPGTFTMKMVDVLSLNVPQMAQGRTLVPWQPRVSLETGLAQSVAWCRKQRLLTP